MNRRRTGLYTLITLITLIITPAAVAEIYKCDGPDGPVYSDQKCGSDSTNVEIQESSGMSGVSDQEKADLAEKKQEREQQREEDRSRSQQDNAVDNQNNVNTTGEPGFWVEDNRYHRNRDNINNLPDKTRPAAPPTEPRPVTLPANTPRKRKNN